MIRSMGTILVALTIGVTTLPPALADNPMRYRLLTEQQAAELPQSHIVLGITAGRAQQIRDGGMTFDIMGVTSVRPGSPAAQAGFRPGDQIIAVNGNVFPSIRGFGAYVGSLTPGTVANIDYMPAGKGPEQAERVAVTVTAAGAAPRQPTPDGGPRQEGLSTGTKLAIGAGAVALLGCYEFGCFSHPSTQRPAR